MGVQRSHSPSQESTGGSMKNYRFVGKPDVKLIQVIEDGCALDIWDCGTGMPVANPWRNKPK